jgi:hypothetical protein
MYSTADLVHCPYLPPSSLSFLGTHDDSVSGIRSSRERRQLELPAEKLIDASHSRPESCRAVKFFVTTPIPPEIPPRLIGYHWILVDVSGHAMP